MSVFDKLQRAAKRTKQDVITVYFVALDPRTPRPVDILIFGIIAYALSPIDFIPDYFFVIGYLDDAVVIFPGILLIMRSQPPEVIADSREKARQIISKPTGNIVMTAIITVWLTCTIWFTYWFLG